jgi:hypothetical protein
MKPSRYFNQAREDANENFMNFGSEDMPFDADELPADGWDDFGADGLYAEGAAPAPQAAPSQPYIISVQNTTTATVSNVVILDAAQRQNNYVISGVSITYGLANITYGQFLSALLSRTFSVGQLRMVGSASSTSNAEAQVLTTVTVTTKDINGNQIDKPFIPQKDSYQQIATQTDIYYNFLVDELTKITFAEIYGSTTLKVYLYPSGRTNKFKQLKQNSGVSNYANPRVNPMLRK